MNRGITFIFLLPLRQNLIYEGKKREENRKKKEGKGFDRFVRDLKRILFWNPDANYIIYDFPFESQ